MKKDKISGSHQPPSKQLLKNPDGPANYVKCMREDIDNREEGHRLYIQRKLANIYILGSFLSKDKKAWRRFCKKTIWPKSLQRSEKPQDKACRWIVAATFSDRHLVSKYSIVCENLHVLECAPEDAFARLQKEGLDRLSKRLGDDRALPKRRGPAIKVKLPEAMRLPETEKRVGIIGTLKPLPRGGYELDVSKLVRLKPARLKVPKKPKRHDR